MTRRLHRAGLAHGVTGRGYRGRVGRGRIIASQVTIEPSADLGDGFALKQLGGPQVLADDVVSDLFEVPLRAWRRIVPLPGTYPVEIGACGVHRLDVEISRRGHGVPLCAGAAFYDAGRSM